VKIGRWEGDDVGGTVRCLIVLRRRRRRVDSLVLGVNDDERAVLDARGRRRHADHLQKGLDLCCASHGC
jgi:hypothetical protein